jgi:DNA-binding IclR family transcriptional regulator
MAAMDADDKNLLRFARELGGVIQITQENEGRIRRLVDLGLLERSGDTGRYRLTEAGNATISG